MRRRGERRSRLSREGLGNRLESRLGGEPRRIIPQGLLRGLLAFALLQNTLRNRLEIPYQSEKGESLEDVVAGIDLPPIETLPRAVRIMMMVVVPSLAHRDQGEPEIVPALI